MAGEKKFDDLQSLLDAIRSSEVVEHRVQLVNKLGDLGLKEEFQIESVLDFLSTYWEDFTCLDITQCMLNKSILQVASRYLVSHLSRCFVKFFTIGIKGSIWCAKHLKMTLMSTEDSQEEEHGSLFFELLLNMLNISASSLSTLAIHPISEEKELSIVESFVSEQLNLTKASISEIKRLQLVGTEVLKVSLKVIEASIKLCEVYADSVNWEGIDDRFMNPDKDNFINVTKCTIDKLCEIGVVAAHGGGSLVSILNVSWKGVVTLLQLGNGALKVKVNVAEIVVTLIALVTEPLRSAADSWCSSSKENISVIDARRTFIPVKFYLVNAVKISVLYPSEVYTVNREIIRCVLMIASLKIALSSIEFRKIASEVITELLEQTSLDWVKYFLNSDKMELEQKLEMLDWLFRDRLQPSSGGILRITLDCSLTYIKEIFSVSCEDMCGARVFLTSRVALFLNLLRCSGELNEDVNVGIGRKLGWCLNILVDENVYSNALTLCVPVLCGSGKKDFVWQPLFSYLVCSFKTFMIVVSSGLAWGEFEAFLIENLFHPHFLCWEILTELWCFLLSYAEKGVAYGIVNKLFSMLKFLASSESVLVSSSSFRKLARLLCVLLCSGTQSMLDSVYESNISDDRSQLSSIVYLALLFEGFPINSLSDNMKNSAIRRIITDYLNFIREFDGTILTACNSDLFGIPVFILSASLQYHQISPADIDASVLKFMVSAIHHYKNTANEMIKRHCLMLLSETLGIVSRTKQLFVSHEVNGVILELESLFILSPVAKDTLLHKCKPDLAQFMAGLSHMEISEKEDDANSCSVWKLYHMLLRERHWALIHLSLTAFGYFAQRTNCNQLWRFVPEDAALSYDLDSGKEADIGRFMSALKGFLDKETGLLTVTPSSEQLQLLATEGAMLKETVTKISKSIEEAAGFDLMEVDSENHCSRKRKFPDGISKGVELLTSGLKIIGDGLSEWQLNQSEHSALHDTFTVQFSKLEDTISNFVNLASGS